MAHQLVNDELSAVSIRKNDLLKYKDKKWIINNNIGNSSDSIHIDIIGVKDSHIVVCYDVCLDGDFEGVYVLINDMMVDIPELGITSNNKGCETGLYHIPTLVTFLDKIVDTLIKR